MSIGVGPVMTAKVVEIEEKKREVRRRRTSKDIVGCVQGFMENNNVLVKLKIWAEERYEYLFDFVDIGHRGGWPRGEKIEFLKYRKR